MQAVQKTKKFQSDESNENNILQIHEPRGASIIVPQFELPLPNFARPPYFMLECIEK
ncbi:MAG: hypothetical protein GF364_03980 [Candidatus Lokiarchaeota archaeon]|nr:hypothetical protein [Candidatus Lokiarchaeota archaeon]